MNVFVTGATGFIGSQIVDRLLTAGHAVVALTRDPAKAQGLVRRGVTLRQGDLRRPELLADAMAGADAVIHTAAAMREARNRQDHLAVNAEGSRQVANAAKASGVKRFVHISTMAVYRLLGHNLREDDPKGPWHAYGASKWLAEQALTEAFAGSQVEWVILRPPSVYGEGERQTDWSRLFADTFRRMPVLPLPYGGDFPLSLIHVETLAEASVAALTTAHANEAYNVHDGQNVRLSDMLALYREVMGRVPRILSVPEKLLDAATWLPAMRLTNRTLKDVMQHGATIRLKDGVTSDLTKSRKRLRYPQAHTFLGTFRQVLNRQKAGASGP